MARAIGDAVALLLGCAHTDDALCGALALAGGALTLLLAATPALALVGRADPLGALPVGAAAALLMAGAMSAALRARARTSALSPAERGALHLSEAAVFVPEALARRADARTVWRGAGADGSGRCGPELRVCAALPTGRQVRELVRGALRGECAPPCVASAHAWWRGYDELCAQLGVTATALPPLHGARGAAPGAAASAAAARRGAGGYAAVREGVGALRDSLLVRGECVLLHAGPAGAHAAAALAAAFVCACAPQAAAAPAGGGAPARGGGDGGTARGDPRRAAAHVASALGMDGSSADALACRKLCERVAAMALEAGVPPPAPAPHSAAAGTGAAAAACSHTAHACQPAGARGGGGGGRGDAVASASRGRHPPSSSAAEPSASTEARHGRAGGARGAAAGAAATAAAAAATPAFPPLRRVPSAHSISGDAAREGGGSAAAGAGASCSYAALASRKPPPEPRTPPPPQPPPAESRAAPPTARSVVVLPAAGGGGGLGGESEWVAVGGAKPRGGAQPSPGAALQARGCAQSGHSGHSGHSGAEESGLSKKQRENRRKAEKARVERERLREAARAGARLDGGGGDF